jgi:predicted metal-dependent enzyme (double-stranded beta helix superfamily)
MTTLDTQPAFTSEPAGPARADPALTSAPVTGTDTRLRNDSLPTARGTTTVRLSPKALAGIARDLAAQTELWQPLLQVDPDRRWYTRLRTGDGWEAWVLTWCLGQGTDLHDHGGSSGAFTVLSGALEELTPAPTSADPTRMAARELSAGQFRSFGASHIHQVTGVSELPAASLHVYGPALTVMNRYRLDAERGPVLAVTERAGQDW